LTRKNRVEEDLIDQLFNSSERRLARLLLTLAHFGDEGAPQPVDFGMDQSTLADMIGTMRVAGELFQEQVSKAGVDQLQWQNPRQQLSIECCSTREANSQ
jgi:hypothetical protein